MLVEKYGIEHATKHFAEIIIGRLTSREIAYQFILEELQGASMGNAASRAFAANSGIDHMEYRHAAENSMPEVDGPDGPQQLLLAASLQLARDPDLMARFRCGIDEIVICHFGFGKFSEIGEIMDQGEAKRREISFTIAPQQNKSRLVELAPKVSHSGLIFDEMNADLGAAVKAIKNDSKEMWMAYAYARSMSAAALYIQGYYSKEDWEYVDSIWRSIGLETDPGVEFQERAFSEAIKFMQTYHHICTSLFAKNVVKIARNCIIPPQNMSDADLIRFVLDFMYEQQQRSRAY